MHNFTSDRDTRLIKKWKKKGEREWEKQEKEREKRKRT